MKIYLVGGALRDQLLNRPIGDKDYLVVGGSPEEMLKLGYKQVGKQFPVFLHPETSEEYALARKEIKVGPGYQGFKFVFDKSITLEEDLLRRDFTVNAMAQRDGELTDLFNGKVDLQNKILRHISGHFVEDPLRVIRGMRFAAQLDFTFHGETKKLLQEMISKKVLNELSNDRIFKEVEKVLSSQNTYLFYKHLEEFEICDAILPGALKIKNERSDLDKYEQLARLYTSQESLQKLTDQYVLPNRYKKLIQYNVAYHEIINEPESVLDFFKRIRFDKENLLSIEKINQCSRGYSGLLKQINKVYLPKAVELSVRNATYLKLISSNLRF